MSGYGVSLIEPEWLAGSVSERTRTRCAYVSGKKKNRENSECSGTAFVYGRERERWREGEGD